MSLSTAARPPRQPFYRGFIAFLARIEDGSILRVAFFAMLAGTIGVLWQDFGELSRAGGEAVAPLDPLTPLLPALDPLLPNLSPYPDILSDRAALEAPLAIALVSGGRLELRGTIDPGAAARFAGEIEARGEYITTVTLDSPGGAVEDAMAIGRLIRQKGMATEVADGALCASSCPLILAAGAERTAGDKAVIGVHQIFASTPASAREAALRDAATAMADTQRTTARITRYLDEMGIAPGLWIHALETPPQQLYFLSPREREDYRLTAKMPQPPGLSPA